MEKFEMIIKDGKWQKFWDYVSEPKAHWNDQGNLPQVICYFNVEPEYFKLSEVDFIKMDSIKGGFPILMLGIKGTNEFRDLRMCYAAKKIVKDE
jgi:hypothetical protein